jgi:hypothetical protein
MFCALGLIFGGTEGIWSRFLRPNSFSVLPMVSGPVFMFYAPGHVFGGAEGVGSCFHVLLSRTRFLRYRGRRLPFLRSRTHFWQYGRRRVLFSFFALPDSFSAVSRTSGPVFLCCAPVLVLGGTEGVRSRFYVLRSLTHFRCYRGRRLPFSCFTLRTRFPWYRGRRVPFSCFELSDSFSAVMRASGPVLMFCAPRLIFDGIEGVGSRFHVLHSRTSFRRY